MLQVKKIIKRHQKPLWKNYFNAFSIKQPQIFTAYTGGMFKLTEAFMAASIAVCVAGIAMIVLYAVLINQKTDPEMTEKTPSEPESNKK